MTWVSTGAFGHLVGRGTAAAHDDRRDDRVAFAMMDPLDAGRQLSSEAWMRMAASRSFRSTSMNSGRSFGRQLDIEFGHDVLDHAARQLDARGDVGIDEVQRHLLVDLVGGVDALEVDVQDQLACRVQLHVAQQAHFLGAIEFMVSTEEWKASLRRC